MTLIDPYKPLLHVAASAAVAYAAYRGLRSGSLGYSPLQAGARAGLVAIAAGCFKETLDASGLTSQMSVFGESLGGTARLDDLLTDYVGVGAALYWARLEEVLHNVLNVRRNVIYRSG